MYLTMNRFKVAKDRAEDFETIWKTRDSHLKSVPGFVAFHLLKGPEAEDHILYASHTTWDSQQHFEDWTKSEAFRMAHAGAGKSEGIMMGRPNLEVFESVQELT